MLSLTWLNIAGMAGTATRKTKSEQGGPSRKLIGTMGAHSESCSPGPLASDKGAGIVQVPSREALLPVLTVAHVPGPAVDKLVPEPWRPQILLCHCKSRASKVHLLQRGQPSLSLALAHQVSTPSSFVEHDDQIAEAGGVLCLLNVSRLVLQTVIPLPCCIVGCMTPRPSSCDLNLAVPRIF